MINREALVRLSTIIAETYGRTFSEGLLEIWWQALDGYDDNLVQRAVVRHIRDPENGSYFPKPADIIRHAHDIRRSERMSGDLIPRLQAPKITPRPWAMKMMDRFMVLTKTHAGMPWPKEEADKIFEDARREQLESENGGPA